MEETQSESLISKFQAAHAQGLRAIQNWERVMFRGQFLYRAFAALRALFGVKAPIAQKYNRAIKNVRVITMDEFTGLVHEFQHVLN